MEEDQEEPEPHCVSGNHKEPDLLQIQKAQGEAEFGRTVVRYQGQARLLGHCWNPQIKLTRTRTELPKQNVSQKDDRTEPEPPHFRSDQEEQEEFKDGTLESDQKNPEGLEVGEDEEEPEPLEFEEGLDVKEDQPEPEPQRSEEKLENPAGLKVEDFDHPQIKEEPEPQEFKEELEGPQMSEDLKPKREPEQNQEEPEPSEFRHQKPQLLSVGEMDPCQPEPDTEQRYGQNSPEPEHNFYPSVITGPEIEEQRSGSEPPPFQQQTKQFCQSWEEKLIGRTFQEPHWAEPETKQVQHQNPPEPQKSFIELRCFHSCVTPDSEPTQKEPEPFHQELSWEEKLLLPATPKEHERPEPEPDAEQVQHQNPPEHQQRFIQLQGFYFTVVPTVESIREPHYRPEPAQHPGQFPPEPEPSQNRRGASCAAPEARPELHSKCYVCGLVVKSKCLDQHLKQHPGVKPHCNKHFASTRKIHMKQHTEPAPSSKNPKPESVFCKKCKTLFAFSSSYVSHLKSHKTKPRQKKAAANSCSKCGRSFRSSCGVTLHQRTCRKVYPCEACGKGYTSGGGVRSHQKRGRCRGNVESKL